MSTILDIVSRTMTVAAVERQRQQQQSVVALVASVGIFVGTALLSQWIQQKQKQRYLSSSYSSTASSAKGQHRQRRHQRSHRPKLGQQRAGGHSPSVLPPLPVPSSSLSRRRRNKARDGNEDDDDTDDALDDDDFKTEMRQYHLYRLYLQQRQQKHQQEQQGWEDEEFDDDEIDDDYLHAARENYIRRRLEDRLSFYGDDDDEEQDEEEEEDVKDKDGNNNRTSNKTGKGNNFHSPIAAKEPESFDNFPKNSNWNHFEKCHGEMTRDSQYRISSTCNVQVDNQQIQQPQQQQGASIEQGDEDDLSIEGSEDYSLEGEHATSNHHGDGSDVQDSEDDASTLTSQLHFVWTGAHYHHDKQNRPQQQQQQQERLQSIHSERDLKDLVPLEAFVPVVEQKVSAGAISAVVSSRKGLHHRRASSSSSSFGSINSNINNNSNSADSSRSPSPPPRVGGTGKLPSRPDGGRSSSTMSNGMAAATRTSPHPLIRSKPKRSSSTSASLLSPSSSRSAGAINHKSTFVPPKLRRKHQVRIMPSSSSPTPTSHDAHVASAAARRRMQQPSSSSKKNINPHLQARANYNARIMPDKLILVRHGQSRGNTDETVYSKIPDNLVPLTELGWEQARQAGRRLRNDILKASSSSTTTTTTTTTSSSTCTAPPPPPRQVHFIVSPYVRTVETFHGIVSAWCDPSEFSHIPNRDARIKAWYSKLLDMGISWAEDPRIREQDFGNLQDPKKIKQSKQERHNFGAFYYRFGSGESAADVFDRMSTFLDSLWRSFDMNQSQYFVLVTHGISIRVLLSRYFRYTVDQFHLLSNPRNCEMVELEHDGKGRLRMAGRHELEECLLSEQQPTQHDADETQKQEPEETSRPQQQQQQQQRRILRYRYHERLRVLPPEFVRTTHIRISPDDTLKKKPTVV